MKPPFAAPELDGYRILDTVGQGATGVVYRAREVEPPSREVAIKVLHLGIDGPALARFEQEFNILRILNHIGVARGIEAGRSRSGRPYFVMEYVAGMPITDYCHRHGLSLEERMELLIRVCQGVQHAHQSGVLHRDLKPANILVESGEEGPKSKVVDFGLAKPWKDAGDRPQLTTVGRVVGTPRYMSPEQATPGADVDTRTDVYALGLVLYELLTGELPSDRGPDGRLEPEAPSRALRRGTRDGSVDPTTRSRWWRRVRGDLDWITLQALSEDPDRRYASPQELAADLSRFLRHESVSVGSPGPLHHLRRAIRRHRAIAVGTLTVFAALSLGIVLSRVGAGWARLERVAADTQSTSILRLGDLRRLEQVRLQADHLGPPRPENAGRLRRWIDEEAYPLVRNLELHQADLETLRQRGRRVRVGGSDAPATEVLAHPEDDGVVRLPRPGFGSSIDGLSVTEEGWEFESREDRWKHDLLQQLCIELDFFAHHEYGAVRRIEKRLELAGQIEQRTLEAPEARKAWAEAKADIAAQPIYRGLELEPQLGLLPLGRNPVSRLWEFWDVASGDRPVRGRDVDGNATWRLRSGSGMVLVLIPPGAFWMGAQSADPSGPNYDPSAQDDVSRQDVEGPVHRQNVAAFFISKYELTWAQWARITGESRRRWFPDPDMEEGKQLRPVASVEWPWAVAALASVGMELPTEVQWEYSARGGTETAWWTGSTIGSLEGAGNLYDQSWQANGEPRGPGTPLPFNDDFMNKAPVGEFRPNPFGLHDTIGNVSEMCRDRHRGYDEPDDTSGVSLSESWTVRGSNYRRVADTARSAYRSLRQSIHEKRRPDHRGLRPVRGLEWD